MPLVISVHCIYPSPGIVTPLLTIRRFRFSIWFRANDAGALSNPLVGYQINRATSAGRNLLQQRSALAALVDEGQGGFSAKNPLRVTP